MLCYNFYPMPVIRENLASYAVKSANSAGRKYKEQEDKTRTAFQRDKDRIIHSKPFRRLSGKTQVFVATYGDHFRDRMTHTLEVSQVARGLARSLKLNEDLCEAIALAHDIGHTPFGHAGEYVLNAIMQKFGGRFEHNEQSKRIVEELEKQFPDFNGLNLAHETLQGLAKHQTIYDQRTKRITGKTLEAQVVDIADEIAYHNHDLDDGLRSLLFSLNDVRRLTLWREAEHAVKEKYGLINDKQILRHRVISHLISMMILDVVKTAARNISVMRIRTLADVYSQKNNAVTFSTAFQKKIKRLRAFLWNKMYQSPQVLKLSKRGQRIIKGLFWIFYKKPRLMPSAFYGRIDAPDALHAVVKDYIAGMTDKYATDIYNKYG